MPAKRKSPLAAHDLATLVGAASTLIVSRLKIPADVATALVAGIFALLIGAHGAITRHKKKRQSHATHPTHPRKP